MKLNRVKYEQPEPELIDWDDEAMKPFIQEYAHYLHILKAKIENEEFELAAKMREELTQIRAAFQQSLIDMYGYSPQMSSIMIYMVVDSLQQAILGIKQTIVVNE